MAAQEELKTNPAREGVKKEKTSQSKNILISALIITKELFVFSLVFYLVLFIFETIFPGFVSNNFNLNWVLGIVLGLGIISAFAPEESKKQQKQEKPKIIDYLTSIFLGFLGGVLIFYKIGVDFYLRLAVAGISGLLIIALSLVLLMTEDEEVKEKEEEIETFVEKTFLSRKTFITPIAFFRLLLFKKVNFPIFLILLVFLLTALTLPQKTGYPSRKLSFGKLASLFKKTPVSTKEIEPSSTPTPTPIIFEQTKKATPSGEILIKILNGGIKEGGASDFTKIFKNAGFKKVFFGDADKFDYKNATIKFRPEDKDQAGLIKDLLKSRYSIIAEVPSGTTSAEISVILGAKELEEVEEEVTILTPE